MLERVARPLSRPDVLATSFNIFAAALIGGALGLGVAAGGHGTAFAQGAARVVDAAAAAIGFRVRSVVIAGNSVLDDETIIDTVGLAPGGSLIAIDAAEARTRLEALTWVAEARVQKLYPATLSVRVTERRPFAVWQRNGELFIIDRAGTVLRPANAGQLPPLPIVAGAGAHAGAATLFTQLAAHPQIADQVAASVRVAERRWTLHLDNGIEVRLPEAGMAQALDRLAWLAREQELLERDIDLVDMRIGTRVFVRQRSEDATGTGGELAS